MPRGNYYALSKLYLKEEDLFDVSQMNFWTLENYLDWINVRIRYEKETSIHYMSQLRFYILHALKRESEFMFYITKNAKNTVRDLI